MKTYYIGRHINKVIALWIGSIKTFLYIYLIIYILYLSILTFVLSLDKILQFMLFMIMLNIQDHGWQLSFKITLVLI